MVFSYFFVVENVKNRWVVNLMIYNDHQYIYKKFMWKLSAMPTLRAINLVIKQQIIILYTKAHCMHIFTF